MDRLTTTCDLCGCYKDEKFLTPIELPVINKTVFLCSICTQQYENNNELIELIQRKKEDFNTIVLEKADCRIYNSGNKIKVPTDIFDDFIKNSIINIRWVEDNSKLEYKMIYHTKDYITMFLFA